MPLRLKEPGQQRVWYNQICRNIRSLASDELIKNASFTTLFIYDIQNAKGGEIKEDELNNPTGI